ELLGGRSVLLRLRAVLVAVLTGAVLALVPVLRRTVLPLAVLAASVLPLAVGGGGLGAVLASSVLALRGAVRRLSLRVRSGSVLLCVGFVGGHGQARVRVVLGFAVVGGPGRAVGRL